MFQSVCTLWHLLFQETYLSQQHLSSSHKKCLKKIFLLPILFKKFNRAYYKKEYFFKEIIFYYMQKKCVLTHFYIGKHFVICLHVFYLQIRFWTHILFGYIKDVYLVQCTLNICKYISHCTMPNWSCRASLF